MTYPEHEQQILIWRAKAADGTLTLDDTRAYIKLLREGRVTAAASSDAAKRKRAVVAIPHADDALRELEGL